MKQLKDAFEYRGNPAPPRSAVSLMRSLGHFPNNSANAMLRTAGPFVALRDAYHFTNGGVVITESDAVLLRQHFQGLVDDVAGIGIGLLRAALGAVSLGPVTGLPGAGIDLVVNKVSEDLRNKLVDSIVSSIPGHYGRCGGFAFSAYDFFLAGWPIDPATVEPGSGDLHDYIWIRLLDSLAANAATFLEWTMILFILPVISKLASGAIGASLGEIFGGPVGATVGAFLAGKDDVLNLGGPGALLDKTRDNWRQLGRNLAGAAAWPIGIIHGGNASPVDQHQVLAVGYLDHGDSTAELDIWDNNDLSMCRRLNLDMRGNELKVVSSNPNLNDIKGIICESYSAQLPSASLYHPPVLQLSNWRPGLCS
jgi:hypothetical protein